MLGAFRASGRHVEVSSGRGVHVIEAGDGVPVVFLHGSSTSSLSLLPVLERLEGVRSIAVDRPGFGLSEPAPVPRARFREAAVEFIDEIVEELELDSLALAGNSMGGTWAPMRSRTLKGCAGRSSVRRRSCPGPDLRRPCG